MIYDKPLLNSALAHLEDAAARRRCGEDEYYADDHAGSWYHWYGYTTQALKNAWREHASEELDNVERADVERIIREIQIALNRLENVADDLGTGKKLREWKAA